MLFHHWIDIPDWASLLIIGLALGTGIVASIIVGKKKQGGHEARPAQSTDETQVEHDAP
jgi:hypothetical protein